MGQTFKGSIQFPSNFDVQNTAPLDPRSVVDSIDDLTNGSIKYPHQGMRVTIKGTSEIWVLLTQGIEESHDINNWALVTGTGSGNELSKYSLPVMTQEMVDDATADSDVEFDGGVDPYMLVDYDASSLSGNTTNNIATTYNGTYLEVMMRAIRSLQMEVARLKNSFTYGIDSYKDTRTAKSMVLADYSNVTTGEPLWAIDPGYLSEIEDSPVFNTYLGNNHSFDTIGTGHINVSVDNQLTFNECKGRFHDGDGNGENMTLYGLADSKLITYIVTDKPDVVMSLVSIDDKTKKRDVDFRSLLNGNEVNKYGFCIVISRKVSDKATGTKKGFNYIYFSIIDYEDDSKLYEGYLADDGTLSDVRVDLNERYSIEYLTFDRLTLSRMKFYTKYEDFSEEVISSAPSEDDYKYEVAHLTIRSVENTTVLNAVKEQLKDNELVWNKKNKTLHIKSNGNVYLIGANTNNGGENDNNNDNMTNKEILAALHKMGIAVNVKYKVENGVETDEIESVEDMSLAPISDVTFVNGDTGKRFTFSVDTEGNLVGKDNSAMTVGEFLDSLGTDGAISTADDYVAVRGFISDYLFRKSGKYALSEGVNATSDAGKKSDRLRISSFYAPIKTDEKHGCTHSFIELENSSNVDIPLTGMYLHFYNPAADDFNGKVYHLALDGVCPAGGTYLVRGAKHAEFDDESAFIKVKTFDKEWYYNGELVSFEQVKVKTIKTADKEDIASDSDVKTAYRFCITYGLADLKATDKLVERSTAEMEISGTSYDATTYPNKILNPRFIDSCSYSTFATVAKQVGEDNPWYINGDSAGIGITITANSMFRLMFALDPAKQAYNGFNTKDGSRIRYNKASDMQILNLDKEFIGYPKTKETIKIERYTPKASFEHRNVMTDKTQLDREKPNMVTCSFGVDVYNTRCFNWISCGTFDEYVWIRKSGESKWTKFQSYVKGGAATEGTGLPRRKEYSTLVNDTVYARMINRFPGNNVLFTAHKCVVVLPDAGDVPVTYEYVVGRPDKDGNPDSEHINDKYTFTLYPRSYEGRTYQITDQQGFHWIEYQVWAASAEFLNTKIASECAAINGTEGKTKVFPILINTGDMTQSGARINEWLDYYNGGKSLFNHLEQMNCVGNNDLCPVSPNDLGTGNDNDKSNSHFFHYFYCFDVKDSDRYAAVGEDSKKFFSGDSVVVPAHTCTVTNAQIPDRYIPSYYYFKTGNVMYIIVNSEIPADGVQQWFGLSSDSPQYVNIYTGIEMVGKGKYDTTTTAFTPLYETMYAWLDDNRSNGNRKVVVAMHEMPFTVITVASLNNAKAKTLVCTRNHPTAGNRLGSNTNQLNISENRGTYWCSRLLEQFGCKIVIGGHKHTYALSYPIKEKYSWKYTGDSAVDGIVKGTVYDSATKTKHMFPTLADEAGTSPLYEVSWDINLALKNGEGDTATDNAEGIANRAEYNVSTTLDKVPNGTTLNSTKTPYVPKSLYDEYGKDNYESAKSGIFRCCTPLSTSGNDKLDGFINYSMCQATGYKLKSNKELPSPQQVFSKIIPMTTHKDTGDSPSGEQLYPMYSVLEFNNDCSELDVKMVRIQNIFASNGEDKFNQSKYGKSAMTNQYLCTYEKEDCDYQSPSMLPLEVAAVDKLLFNTDEKKIYKCVENNNTKSWELVKERMYGKWLDESEANERLQNYLDNPTTISDNRYLHIKF